MKYLGKDIGFVRCAWCVNEATEIAMLQKICKDCLADYQEEFQRVGH